MVGQGTGGHWCRGAALWCCMAALALPRVAAQEVLLPLLRGPVVPPTAKASDEAVALPFFDDFASGEPFPSAALWQRGGATLSGGAGLLPPTVGVATLDAIGADGALYPGAGAGRYPADTLLSRSLLLAGLTPADSVVVSFFYLPGGGGGNRWETIGDAPEAGDSLLVEFFREADSTWVTVWGRGGTTVDSLLAATGRAWQYVAIAVADTQFLNDAFRFRFRNICSQTSTSKPGLSGNGDQWHIDYVVVDRGRRTTGDASFRDVAFVEPAPSLLAHYAAMPARQYRRSEMAPALEMTIANLFSMPLATHYGYAIVDGRGDTLHCYDGGYENAPAFLPDGTYQDAQAHARPSVGYAFPEGEGARSYTVVHTVREGVGGDDHGENDTVRFRQVFADYYAYDDGTAEDGYGLTSTASRVFLAYRFDLNEEDTLTAVEICFNHTLRDENEEVPFYLTVWHCEGGQPGEVVYRDSRSRYPQPGEVNAFHRYVLERPVVVADTLFVGFEQGNNRYINMGFDRSRDTRERIFYLTGTEWQQSILRGSLMMRPYFGTAAMVGVESPQQASGCRAVPNPSSQQMRIEGLPEGSRIRIFDMRGRLVAETRESVVATAAMAEGVYVAQWTSERSGASGMVKFIVKH
ncbi:MAG: T9SS type A sorting domain-containing protein [Bacteroidales bacterium]|nr:T9SS type A sorting domain-containing protein [Bacteroidales bacterium]